MSEIGANAQPAAESLDTFDPWSNEWNRGNIWTTYAAMREAAPAIYSSARCGFWLVSRYADVRQAALNTKVFSSSRGSQVGVSGTTTPPSAAIEYDPPDHRRFRSVMIAPFTAARIGELSGLVDRHVRTVVDRALAAGSFDVVHDLGAPLAVGVISEIIGFDDEARERNRELALALVAASHEEAVSAHAAYDAFLAAEVRRRIETAMPGFLGELVTRSMADGQFEPSDLLSIARAMALAGHHTTINGVASMLVRAAEPDLRGKWLSSSRDDSAISRFVEESLRIDPPIHMEARQTTAAVDIGGVVVPADEQVALLFAAANHDESVYPDPEEFLPSRPAGHLAFGHGIHTCLGMGLARLEMAALLKRVLEQMPGLRLNGEPVDSGMFFGHHMGWDSVPAAVE
jgi:cytochrome P450